MVTGIKTIDALKKLSKEQLSKELLSAQKELFTTRMKKEQGELKQTHHIRIWKRYIAQIHTFLNN